MRKSDLGSWNFTEVFVPPDSDSSLGRRFLPLGDRYGRHGSMDRGMERRTEQDEIRLSNI